MKMFRRFLIDMEERLAAEDDPFKSPGTFTAEKFHAQSGEADGAGRQLDPMFPEARIVEVRSDRDNLILSMSSENGVHEVPIKIVRASRERRRCIVIPHWNAQDGSYHALMSLMRFFGVTSYLITLPYHGKRGAGSRIANEFLSADLDKTVEAVRQSVAEVRGLIGWLTETAPGEVAVLGISLGSCIAGLLCTVEQRARRYALVLSAGDFAETVWEGRATRHIRGELEGKITLERLRKAWAEISPESYVESINTNRPEVYMINGYYDTVVPPKASQRFIEMLRRHGIAVRTSMLWCGHYTLSVFPFNVIATLKIIKFIVR
jgi:hypothetical protein